MHILELIENLFNSSISIRIGNIGIRYVNITFRTMYNDSKTSKMIQIEASPLGKCLIISNSIIDDGRRIFGHQE